jgi:hypothetical protein
MNVYHKSSTKVYIDNGDGSLTVFSRNGVELTNPNHVHVRNDDLGRKFLKTVFKGKVLYTCFRCPKNGKGYDHQGYSKYNRRGNLRKNDSLVIYAAIRGPRLSDNLFR